MIIAEKKKRGTDKEIMMIRGRRRKMNKRRRRKMNK